MLTRVGEHLLSMLLTDKVDMALLLLVAWSSSFRPKQLSPLQAQFPPRPVPACGHWCFLLDPPTNTIGSRLVEGFPINAGRAKWRGPEIKRVWNYTFSG